MQFSKFKKMNEKDLSVIIGGGNIGAALQGLFGGFTNSPSLEQLNGVKLPKPRSCSPYGTGGTPNAC
ncbi:bacteriocin leader domain-containing protein [Streptococcus penaeicida]|uniref:Bacteriocin leader domain-containing protein n=1 Tax=Streptococcus penaeicida TaxID=1765960 RepID=A0A2N8LE95_9STRE|nr:bacteriocin [Streptococcus penaeicida]PND48482.1 bacteriocin leader domain-containing protein [Streptococcus penaeicida]